MPNALKRLVYGRGVAAKPHPTNTQNTRPFSPMAAVPR